MSSPGSERGSDELSLMIELENLNSRLARLELRVMEQDFQRHEAVRWLMIGANMTAAVQVTDTHFAFHWKSMQRRLLERHFEQSKEQKRLSRRLRWSRRKRLRRLRRMLRRRRRLRKNAQKKEEEEAELESSSQQESMPELCSTSSESVPEPVLSSSDTEDSRAKRSKSARKLFRTMRVRNRL